MRLLLVLLTCTASITANAQSNNGSCNCPPCAPGSAIYVFQGSTPTVKVKCEDTSTFDCFSLATPTGPVGPDKVTQDMSGVLTVHDADGKPVGEKTQVKLSAVETDDKGKKTYTFIKE